MRLLVYAHPSEMNLVNSGFVKETGIPAIWLHHEYADQASHHWVIYCDNQNGALYKAMPKSDRAFRPNDIIIIISNGGVGNSF